MPDPVFQGGLSDLITGGGDQATQLPPNFDYGSLERALTTREGQALPEQVKAKMRAAIAQRPKETPGFIENETTNIQRLQSMGMAERAKAHIGQTIESVLLPAVGIAQVAHDVTMGLIPEPNLNPKEWSEYTRNFWDGTFKPLIRFSSVVASVRGFAMVLSHIGKVPVASRMLEQIPLRMQHIGAGAIIGGAVDAMRPADWISKDPSLIDVSDWGGKKISDATGMPRRAGLAIAGAAFGGAIGEVIMGVAAGVQKGRSMVLATKLGAPELAAMRTALEQSGIVIEDGANRFKIAQAFVKNLRKIAMPTEVSGPVADRLAREQYILDEVIGSANSARAKDVLAETGEYSTQNLSKLLTKGAPGIAFEPFAPSAKILRMAARDQDGNPIGLLTMSRTGDKTADVFTVFVDPKHRRQGVATKMYDAVEASGIQLRSGESGLTGQGEAFVNSRAAKLGRPPVQSSMQRMADEWVAQADAPAIPRNIEDDARLIAGVFRTNPGGVTIVKGVTSVDALDLARTKLGINLDQKILLKGVETDADGVLHGVYDVVLARPAYKYPDFGTLGRLTDKVTRSLKALAAQEAKDIKAPRTTEAYILADGTPVRGGLRTSEIETKLKLQQPVVDGVKRPDLALRSAAQHVRMDLVNEKELVIDLPNRLTQQQFNALGRSIDAVQMNRVTIRGIGGQEKILTSPIGAQVQDAVAELVKPQSVGSTLTDAMVHQYRRTGVFQGQAVVLPDGTAGEIVSKAGALKGQGARYRIKDSLTGTIRVVSEKQVTLLPTTLNSELQPSNLFTQYLDDTERIALSKLRFATSQGWADEITKVRDLKEFGNTRGYTVTALRGGKFELAKVNDGGSEPILVSNMKSAVAFLRNDSSNLPQLTSERVSNLLGENLNFGWIGGGGHSPNIGELMPVHWKHLEAAVERLLPDRGVGLGDLITKPSKALFDKVDKLYDLQFGKMFENVQSSLAGKQNFEALWFSGKGGKLPEGILPLKKVFSMGGEKANWEAITDWREAVKGTAEAEAMFKALTPNEQKAAEALAKWYDSAYSHFGIEAPFVENYMPHMREMAERGNGTDIATLWKLIGGDPLHPPKGMDWIADHVRNGLMDIYEKDARKVAVSYLRGAGHARFMREPTEQAQEVMKLVYTKNKQLGLVMANYMDAIRGTEFPEQRAALGETFRRILENLPGDGKVTATAATADKLVDVLTGAVYASTMGFRPSLALRNASSALVMAWPLYGGNGRFVEAMSRAMTREGLQEAIKARAITIGQAARFSQPEVEQALRDLLPEKLVRINEIGMGLYESADQFTRSVTYHAAKIRAEDAILRFAKTVEGANPGVVEAAKKRLLVDSRMFLHSKDVTDDFLRRAGQNPTLAAEFAGKQASDITNFLYGRGMQARWMRSVGGRLFGQFGTWPMWYLDYLNRIVTRIGQAGYSREAMKLLGRHALVNAAIVGAGKEVLDVDLSKWASYGALFYSGGPGLTVLAGASTLMRGLGEVTSTSENPLAQSRVTEGMQTIWHTLPTYVPGYFGARDAIRLAEADDNVQRLAALLGTRPTRSYTSEQRMDMLLGTNREPFTGSNMEVQDVLNAKAMGRPVTDIRGLGPALGLKSESFGIPEAEAQVPTGSRTSMSASGPAGSLPTATPEAIRTRSPNESTKPAESKPIKEF